MDINVEAKDVVITLKLTGKEKEQLEKEISQLNDHYNGEENVWRSSYPLVEALWNAL